MLYRMRRTLGSPRPWKHLMGPTAPTQEYIVPTRDGLSLHLRRIRPREAVVGRAPVMLLHGLGSNHYSFHFPERSLAYWLSERGHDVWLPELRGHGTSIAKRYDWGIDEYLTYDLPAFLEAIRLHSDCDEVHWVGHSMGGVLLMSYGILNPQSPIGRGMSVASALDYKVGATGFKQLLMLRPILERLGAIPYGTLTHLLAPVTGRRGVRALDTFNAWPSNIEPEVVRMINARCFHTIPTSLLSSLATTFEPEGLCLKSGVRIEAGASEISFPLLMLAGSRDAQVGPEAVLHTAKLIGDNAKVVVHGPDKGDADHYGHWDLLIGRRAEQEVWPGIAEWLESSPP